MPQADLSFLPDKPQDLSFLPDKPQDLSFLPDKPEVAPESTKALAETNAFGIPKIFPAASEEIASAIKSAVQPLNLLKGFTYTPLEELPQDYQKIKQGITQGVSSFQGKPFNQFTGEDWQRFIAQNGIQAAQAAMAFAGIKAELPKLGKIGGELDASRIGSTAEVPVREVRPSVGEEAPLRQQGETAGPQTPAQVTQEVNEIGGDVNEQSKNPQTIQTNEATSAPPLQGGAREASTQEVLTPSEPAAVSGTVIPPAAEPPTVGISQARTEEELGEGSVEPGVGSELGKGLEYGRKYINKGGDPRLPIRRAVRSGIVSQNDVGIVHAELERLRGERNTAAAALENDPENPLLQLNLEEADNAQRAWRKELQPVLTKASDALREAHASSSPNADPGTYQGLADIMDEHFKGEREITPEMRTAMAKAAKGVKDIRDSANGEFAKVEGELTKRIGKKRVMTPKELDADLRSELENQFKDCVLS